MSKMDSQGLVTPNDVLVMPWSPVLKKNLYPPPVYDGFVCKKGWLSATLVISTPLALAWVGPLEYSLTWLHSDPSCSVVWSPGH